MRPPMTSLRRPRSLVATWHMTSSNNIPLLNVLRVNQVVERVAERRQGCTP